MIHIHQPVPAEPPVPAPSQIHVHHHAPAPAPPLSRGRRALARFERHAGWAAIVATLILLRHC